MGEIIELELKVAMALDIIIKGNVITVDNQKPRAEAFRIKGDKIVSVGSIKEVEQGAGKATEVLDFAGKTVLPGFVDTHTHMLATSRNMLGIDLSSVNSVQEVLIKINQRAKTTPSGKLVFGCEFNRLMVSEKRFPYLNELDAASLAHPTAIQHFDTHFFMLNSLAFKLFGLNKEMDGVIKDVNGNPTGVIEDPISTDIWNKLVNIGDDNEKLEALQAVSQAFLKVGITTAHTKENLQDVILIMKNLESVPVRIKPMLFFYPLKAEKLMK